jgi:hypothetical protein
MGLPRLTPRCSRIRSLSVCTCPLYEKTWGLQQVVRQACARFGMRYPVYLVKWLTRTWGYTASARARGSKSTVIRATASVRGLMRTARHGQIKRRKGKMRLIVGRRTTKSPTRSLTHSLAVLTILSSPACPVSVTIWL